MQKKTFGVLPRSTNFCLLSPFIQSQIELAMKNQSGNNLNLKQDQQNISSIFPEENRPTDQKKTKNFSDYKKQRKITIGNFFDCTEEADFFVIISKFVMLFNVDIDKMACSSLMQKQEIEYIKEYKHESLLAETNRKHIMKQFKKSVNWWHKTLATLGDENRLFLIIQNIQGDEQKIQVKFLTNQNLIQAILSNMSTESSSQKKSMNEKGKKKSSTPISTKQEIDHNLKCQYFQSVSEAEKSGQKYQRLFKFIEEKFSKFKSALCIQKLKDRYTPLNNELISYFSAKFNEMYYVAAYSQSFTKLQDFPPSMVLDIKGRKLNFCSSQKRSFVSNLEIKKKSMDLIQHFYQSYQVIDKIIHAQIEMNPKLNLSAVLQNQLYISFYGIYYNFILLNKLQGQDYLVMQQKILSQLIEEKNIVVKRIENQEKKVMHRKLGHYPERIEVGSKLCCVCEKDNKKTRYKCQLCTHIYGRDICICVNHFKKYHSDPSKYIPKGVRKGALKMEIKQFHRRKVCETAGKDEMKSLEEQVNRKDKTSKEIEEQWRVSSKNFEKDLNSIIFFLTGFDEKGIEEKVYPKQNLNENQMSVEKRID